MFGCQETLCSNFFSQDSLIFLGPAMDANAPNLLSPQGGLDSVSPYWRGQRRWRSKRRAADAPYEVRVL